MTYCQISLCEEFSHLFLKCMDVFQWNIRITRYQVLYLHLYLFLRDVFFWNMVYCKSKRKSQYYVCILQITVLDTVVKTCTVSSYLVTCDVCSPRRLPLKYDRSRLLHRIMKILHFSIWAVCNTHTHTNIHTNVLTSRLFKILKAPRIPTVDMVVYNVTINSVNRLHN